MKITIKTKDFIAFLKLFKSDEKIEGLQFGDTLYKREGWIDASILNGEHTVDAIVQLNYSFDGLQGFMGELDEYQIHMKPRRDEYLEFEIESSESQLRDLEYKVIEKNAYFPRLFELSYVKKYDNS